MKQVNYFHWNKHYLETNVSFFHIFNMVSGLLVRLCLLDLLTIAANVIARTFNIYGTYRSIFLTNVNQWNFIGSFLSSTSQPMHFNAFLG